jgi:predicted RNase H-like HicB family nuclease
MVFEHRLDGYSGFVPDLPGCISTAATLEAMRRNMREAIHAQVAILAKLGEAIPQPKTTTVHFPRPSEGHGIDHWVVERLEVTLSKSGHVPETLEPKRRRAKKARTADPSTSSAARTALRMTSHMEVQLGTGRG